MTNPYPTLYQGSVKDLLGPARFGSGNSILFKYSDAYSVFDWGRMPDLLPHKGESLAVIAADWFEKMERPENWREFSKAPEALALRKANRFGAAFMEMGEELQSEGLRTHYLGVLPDEASQPTPLKNLKHPPRFLAVKQVSVVKPLSTQIMGRSVPDYFETRISSLPRLVPLEVVFRFSCPPGSSLFERMKKDPAHLDSIGYSGFQLSAGASWDFPVLELFSKLESTDRFLTLSEALAISGLRAEELSQLMFKTAWVAAWARSVCAKSGLELADGKLEWGIMENGECFLVDAIGPDELRILRDGVQLSKEFLRIYYRTTPWHAAVENAKAQAKVQGIADWKRAVGAQPPVLPPALKELAGHLYCSLANQVTGKSWFPESWSLDQVIQGIRDFR